MLPGFNIDKDEQFMAIEAFSSGLHNRSDEAFTIADLEKFRDTSSKSRKVSTKDNTEKAMDPSTKANEKTPKKTNTSVYQTKGKTILRRNDQTGGKKVVSAFRNLEPYEDDDMPKSENIATDEEDDPEIPSDEIGIDDELELAEEGNDEEPINNEESSGGMGENSQVTESEPSGMEEDMQVTEGFTGSMLSHVSWLSGFLKALLLTFIMFVLMHPSTSKILAKFGGKLGNYKDLLLCLIFFILAYVTIIAF